MPSEVYKALVKAGYTGTEQEMYATFANNSVTSTAIGNWSYAYNVLTSAGNAGDVLTNNGAGIAPTWEPPTGGGGNSYFPSGW